MGFGSWLSSKVEAAKNFGKKALDTGIALAKKTREGVKKGLELYSQGKDIYEQGKSEYSKAKGQLSSLPVIGDVAKEYLGKAEARVGQNLEKLSEKGINAKNLELAAGLARRGLRETRAIENM